MTDDRDVDTCPVPGGCVLCWSLGATDRDDAVREARNLFRTMYRPDMDEGDKVRLWAEHAPLLAQDSRLHEDAA